MAFEAPFGIHEIAVIIDQKQKPQQSLVQEESGSKEQGRGLNKHNQDLLLPLIRFLVLGREKVMNFTESYTLIYICRFVTMEKGGCVECDVVLPWHYHIN